MTRIFADGASVPTIRNMSTDDRIAGFTTNPSLARKAGVSDYREFCLLALEAAGTLPVSLEVIADDFEEMKWQAHEIASWGENAVVKIPVSNTKGDPTYSLIKDLSEDGIPLNVTAVFSKDQVRQVAYALAYPDDHTMATAIVSVFAGRIADVGVDPLDHMSRCHYTLKSACPRAELLWASPRQVYDFVLAQRAKCEIITMTPELIAKMALFGKDLEEYSRETVQMFFRDAQEAGFEL